jgi:hypothetical protein
MALLYEEGVISADEHQTSMLRPIVSVYIGGETLMILADTLWSELLLPSGFPASAPVGDSEQELPVVELELATEVISMHACVYVRVFLSVCVYDCLCVVVANTSLCAMMC